MKRWTRALLAALFATIFTVSFFTVSQGEAKALDPENTLYLDLMAHWNTVLPGVVREVCYEALVGDFDTEAARLLSLVGLEWDDSVRNFHKASRAVQTASAAQVRQPIYASSVGHADKVPSDLLDTLRVALAG